MEQWFLPQLVELMPNHTFTDHYIKDIARALLLLSLFLSLSLSLSLSSDLSCYFHNAT